MKSSNFPKSSGVVLVQDSQDILAVVILSSFKKEGIHFFTPGNFSQQLAYMKRPSGYQISAHLHNPLPRQVKYTKEVLYIKSGRVRVDFYNDKKKYLESLVLGPGDVVLLSYGGHGFEMLEPTEIIEVKQGPYAGEIDKTIFDSVERSKIKIRRLD